MSKKITRKTGRIRLLQVLYAWEAGGMELSRDSLDIIREHYPLEDEEDFEFTNLLVDIINTNIRDVDLKIEYFSRNWKIYRMDKVDLALLRLGTAELMYSKLPYAIVINEAVELSKLYGSQNSPRFVNGILHNIATK